MFLVEKRWCNFGVNYPEKMISKTFITPLVYNSDLIKSNHNSYFLFSVFQISIKLDVHPHPENIQNKNPKFKVQNQLIKLVYRGVFSLKIIYYPLKLGNF